MNEVWELDWISDEKDWSVVSNHVVVAFFSVELYRESTRVSIAIIGSTFSSDSGESEEDVGLLPDGAEEVSFGPSKRRRGH